MKKNKLIIPLSFLAFLLFSSIPHPAHALQSLTSGIGCISDGSCTMNDFVKLALGASKMILGISGSAALLFFVYGGVTFLISGGSQEKVTKGKQILIGSVIGLFIIFGSYTIIGFTLKAMGITNTTKWFTTDPNKR